MTATRLAHSWRSRGFAKWAVAISLLVLAVSAHLALRYTPYIIAAVDARSRAHELASDIAVMQLGDVDSSRLESLHARLNALGGDVDRLHLFLAHDPLADLARAFGPTADAVAQADHLITASTDLGQAASTALDLGDRFAALRQQSEGANGPSLLSGIIGLMATSGGDVDRIRDLVVRARQELTGVPAVTLPQIAEAAQLMGGAIDRYGPLLDQYVGLDQAVPEILGWGGTRRYLVLAQDPAELRPTGGYIGTVGIVGFSGGNLSERSFQDVYNLDLRPGVPFVEPPEPLVEHLLGESSWQLADANWSPDFPAAAQNALRLYTLESGDQNVDGVIGLTTYALDRLMEVTGPLEVPDYGVTVQPGEVTLTTLALTRGISTPDSQRKAFLDALASTVIDRLYSLPTSAWPALFDAFKDISDERLMLAWFKDPAAESLVSAGAFGGALRQDAGDYLYVVEANVAPTSKYNLVVQRTDRLAVALATNGDATSALRLDWQNDAMAPGEPYATLRSYATSTAGIYGSYVRVYTPSSSQFTSASGAAIDPVDGVESVTAEGGRNVFGNYLLMAPGPANLAYTWTTPAVAVDDNGEWSYTLTIQKQPGLRSTRLTATVTLPAGATVDYASPGATVTGETVTLETVSLDDTQLQVRYRLP